MSDLQTYLNCYYQTAERLAATCGISADELALLVEEKLVPEPSYIVKANNTFISQAFGELVVYGADAGQYFHPGNAAWIKLALKAKSASGAQAAHLYLRDQFKRNFIEALQFLDKTMFRLSDSFTETGQHIAGGLKLRSEAAWNHFLNGVFSLCVADPSSEMSIARKEILQEALNAVCESDIGPDSPPEARRHVLDLIDQYAKATMPFSPPEYPLSSRKRLTEDLRAKIIALK